jgi:DNA-binding response OmpR family regulator
MKVDNVNELNDLSKLKVLVIDDSLLVQDTLKYSLRELGVSNVQCATKAYYGLNLCSKETFHVIFCAFNVKSDKDGFHLLEELKFKRYVTQTTVMIFLSTDTDESLVNSIIELEPDDFWVKPLRSKSVQQRFIETLKTKRELFNIYNAIDNQSFSKAIYFADRHLLNEQLVKLHPRILRMKGEALLSLCAFEDAEIFYVEVLKRYKYGWVYIGYVKSLLKQNRLAEIDEMLKGLINKPETRFAAHDILAQYHIDAKNYADAYEEIQHATSLSPRNIERNKKSWDLARLNHDHQGQYIATQNIAHYAKNSIHDSPELLLNVIRAGIDLASTVSDDSAVNLLKKTDLYIQQLEKTSDFKDLFQEQLLVVKARLYNVRGNSDKAKKIIDNHISLQVTAVLEDGLDKVKVLHELSMREEAIAMLKQITQNISGDTLNGQVLKEYFEQETQERKTIHFTSKQLSEMADQFIEKKKYLPALDKMRQAIALTPSSIKLTIRSFEILTCIKHNDEMTPSHEQFAQETIEKLENLELPDKADQIFEKLKLDWLPDSCN